ncbi:MAG TPA: succinate dehydrogenase assembly factor 2 [Steroidobacteraceae bacterium]|nr:succinate dehydrogenase assembly factor 2 [Steroidobacteraceae bacterium]
MPDARAAPPAQLETDARRLLWRCRRGMKELDVILERFARAHLAAAGGGERELFARFLELPDPLLAEYLLGGGEQATAALPGAAEFAPLARSILGSVTEPASPADNC